MEPEREPSSPDRSPALLPFLLGILASSLVIIGWIRSKVKTPLRAPSDDSNDSDNTKHPTAYQRASSQNIPPSPTGAAINTIPPTDRPPRGRPAAQDSHEPPERKTPLVQWLIFGATFVYAAITLLIYCEMQKQTRAQRTTLINSERAWVGIDVTPQVEFTSWDQRKYQGTISSVIKNFGKGPAFKVKASHRIVTSHIDDTVQQTCNLMFPFVGLKTNPPVTSSDETFYKRWAHVMFAGQQASPVTSIDGNTSELVGKEAYIVGCIVYKDQFGQAHWTKFCYNTGPYVTQVVKDPSSFSHLEACNTKQLHRR